MLDIGWSDVLNNNYKYHGHIDLFFEKVVIPSGYPYFLWNDVVYKVEGKTYIKIDLNRFDL